MGGSGRSLVTHPKDAIVSPLFINLSERGVLLLQTFRNQDQKSRVSLKSEEPRLHQELSSAPAQLG
jgi:hypothetical protein